MPFTSARPVRNAEAVPFTSISVIGVPCEDLGVGNKKTVPKALKFSGLDWCKHFARMTAAPVEIRNGGLKI